MSEFLSPRIIFGVDLMLSVLASALVLFFLTVFSEVEPFSGYFIAWWLGGSLVFSIVAMLIFRSYNVIVRHSTLRDLANFVFIFLIKDVLLAVLLWVLGLFSSILFVALFYDLLLSVFLIICVRLLMVYMYDSIRSRLGGKDSGNFKNSAMRVLAYGLSDKSVASVTRFLNSPHYKLIGFLSDNHQDHSMKISDYPIYVYESEEDFKNIVTNMNVGAIMFSTESDAQKEQNGLISFCANNGIKTLIAPSVDEVIGGRFMKSQIREVKIEDLLGRPEIKISLDTIKDYFKNKVIMVTGAAGSIGSELCRQLATFGIKKLILFDNAETPMHNLRLELEARFP